MENEQNQRYLTSGMNLIPQKEGKENTVEPVVSPWNEISSQCPSPSSSHVAFIPGQLLYPERPKNDGIWHRRRTLLRPASRSTMWFVQVSTIMVTLAMTTSVALMFSLREAEGSSKEDGGTVPELDMEDDRGTGWNNGTNSIAAATMSPTHDITAKSTNLDSAPKVAILSVDELIRMAHDITAASTSIVTEADSQSTYDPLIFPYPAKSSDKAAAKKVPSAREPKTTGSSSTVYGFGVKERKDFHLGLSSPNNYVMRTTKEKHTGVTRSPPTLPNKRGMATNRTRRLFRLDRKNWLQERDLRHWRRKSVG